MAVAEEKKKARRKAMRLLEHMDRTERGLSERLHQAGFSSEAVEDAMQYVRSYGYINDERYAFQYISYRIHDKSQKKILEELRQKGVDRNVALEAWEKVLEIEEPDERQILKKLIQKKYESGARISEKDMRRLYGQLARRGFKMADIVSVLEELDIVFLREENDCIF